ncbi:hypothetical protein [Nostoc sp.]
METQFDNLSLSIGSTAKTDCQDLEDVLKGYFAFMTIAAKNFGTWLEP